MNSAHKTRSDDKRDTVRNAAARMQKKGHSWPGRIPVSVDVALPAFVFNIVLNLDACVCKRQHILGIIAEKRWKHVAHKVLWR